jgi:outer membrane protein, heavy metal efflux system
MLRIAIFLVAIALAGCKVPLGCRDMCIVNRELQKRVCLEVPSSTAPCNVSIPSSVVVEDGLSEDEAVTTALANNSAFQTTLEQLRMAGGDVMQSELLANPQVLLYFPVGNKQGQYTIYGPIESYLMRPTRVKIANREFRRIGDQLVQNGLSLVRDVRNAYTDLSLAEEQLGVAQEAIELRSEIANLTNKRLEAGDISKLETLTARVDALNAQANAGLQEQNVNILNHRLTMLLGLPWNQDAWKTEPLQPPEKPGLPREELVACALRFRPDYQSATWGVAAAEERERLSQWSYFRMDAVLDARSNGGNGFQIGPGLRFDLPIFNRNQGGIARAHAEYLSALHARDTIRDQIVMEVRTAFDQFHQADQNYTIVRDKVMPAIQDAVGISKKGFADGGTDYLLVLQTTTQYLDGKQRMLTQIAAMRRAYADLERAVGCCLQAIGDANGR